MVNVQVVANRVQRSVANREGERERRSEFLGREYIIKGQYLVDGVGESVAPLNFPVTFIEKPIFTYGSELYPGQGVADGEFPEATAMVIDWKIVEKGPKTYYTGATVATVLVGPSGTRIFLNYRFEGKAIANPVNSVETSDSVV
jgi:hypothetical protein